MQQHDSSLGYWGGSFQNPHASETLGEQNVERDTLYMYVHAKVKHKL